MDSRNERSLGWLGVVVLGALALAFVAIACIPFFSRGGEARLISWNPDVLLHLRGILQTLARGGVTPTVDWYTAFPNGYAHVYAPIMDAAHCHFIWAVLQVWPAIPLRPSEIAGFVPVFFGVIAYLGTLLTFWRIYRSWTLVLLLGIFALPSAKTIQVFRYAECDHHFLEVFFIWWWVASSLLWLSEREDRWLIVGAVGVTGLHLSWTGAPLADGLGVGLVVLGILAGSRELTPLLTYMASTLLIAGGLQEIYLIRHGYQWQLSFEFFGHFQAMAALGIGAWAKLAEHLAARWPARRAVLVSLGIGGLGLAATMVVFPVIAGELQQGLALMANRHPVFSNIVELKPLIKEPLRDAAGACRTLLSHFSVLVLFAPLALLYSRWSRDRIGHWMWLWTIAVFVLTLMQVRYTRWQMPFFAWFQAITLHTLMAAVVQAVRGSRRFLVACVVVPVFLLTMVLGVDIQAVDMGNMYSRDLGLAYVWLSENSPVTSGWDDDVKPAYGVLTFWDLGNAMSFYGRRPAICNNTLLGVERMARTYLASSEAVAYGECVRNCASYVIVDGMFEADGRRQLLEQMLTSQGRGDFFSLAEKPAVASLGSYTPLYQWLGQGLGLRPLASWSVSTRFRLVYSNRAGFIHNRPVDVYAVVTGAMVEGLASPGERLQLVLPIKVNGRLLFYQRAAEADAVGRYSARVAYPSGSGTEVVALDPRYLVVNARTWQPRAVAAVSEQAIASGTTVTAQPITPAEEEEIRKRVTDHIVTDGAVVETR